MGLAAAAVTSAVTVLAVLTPAQAAPGTAGGAAPQAASGARGPAVGDGGVRHGEGTLSSRLGGLLDAESAGLGDAATAQSLSVARDGAGSLLRTADGALVVTVRLADYSLAAVAAIQDAGGTVVNRNPQMSRVTVTVADGDLAALGAVEGVQHVDDVLEPQVNATCDTTISQGDTQLRSAELRASRALNGSGVKVGVLSDTYDKAPNPATTAPQDVTSDNLPGTTNTCGHTTPVITGTQPSTGTDEGRAMAQIVHDVAPAADIDFESAFNGQDAFAASINKLADQGADVIVDDVSYFDEPMYQEGIVAQAVTAVRARGVDYFSSSANNRLVSDGKEVGSYEAVDGYRPSSCPSAAVALGYADCHDFNTTGTSDPTFSFTANSATDLIPVLGWAEPWNGVQTDLDLLLIDKTTGQVVAGSGAENPGANGSQKPFESFTSRLASGRAYDLVVARYPSASPAAPRFKLIFAENGRQPFRAGTMDHAVATGTDVMGPTTYGHNGGSGTVSVGASRSTVSPAALESFSSYGPVTTLFGPVTGSGVAAPLPAPVVMTKPDLVASDCVRTTFFTSATSPFCGTSAAAPHAAAVAALLRQQRPAATPEQVNAALVASAVPITTVPLSFQGGGLVDAVAAGTAMALTPPSAPALSAVSPGSSGPGRAPVVSGTAPAGTSVRLFANATCQGAPAAVGTASDLAAGLTVRVASRSVTSFSALAVSGQSASACSSSTLTYTNTVAATAAPSLASTGPLSPSPSTTPAVIGSAPSGSTVALYTDATCSGVPVATGPAATFGSSGLRASVAAGSTTTFRARATTDGDNVSACSTTSVTYVSSSSTPQFANTAAIVINDNAKASSYPSTISVSGQGAPITDVNVTLSGLNHDYLGDVGVVLQAPNGDSIVLMNAVSGSAKVRNVNLTFDDQAAQSVSAFRAASGVVRPGDYTASSVTFAAPAPAGGSSAPRGTTTLASAFGGDSANGDWKLFVQDFYAGDAGSIDGGWSLQFDSVSAPVVSGAVASSSAPASTPSVFGSAPSGSTVNVYTNAACTGSPAASGTAAAFASPGLPVTVAGGATTFFATATDAAGKVSPCSTTSATYLVPPAAPTLTGTTPASPGASTTPLVSGSAQPGSTVTLYTDSACAGPVAASGAAASFASPGLPVTVAVGSTTTFYATASLGSANVSPCSTTSVSYVQRPAVVTPPVTTAQTPDTTLTATPGKKVKTKKSKVAVTFAFTSSLPGATFVCTLDGKVLGSCVSGKSFKVKQGKHTFTVAAVANGLRDATPAAFAFKVVRKR